ncbi:hypothetical protein [Deinococcus sonorensis]|uniref:SlyX family protein n=2 Tax=Deinococcus sonorensis TaxID=309891 RepID=A0AAU7U6I6_9DEIO
MTPPDDVVNDPSTTSPLLQDLRAEVQQLHTLVAQTRQRLVEVDALLQQATARSLIPAVDADPPAEDQQ